MGDGFVRADCCAVSVISPEGEGDSAGPRPRRRRAHHPWPRRAIGPAPVRGGEGTPWKRRDSSALPWRRVARGRGGGHGVASSGALGRSVAWPGRAGRPASTDSGRAGPAAGEMIEAGRGTRGVDVGDGSGGILSHVLRWLRGLAGHPKTTSCHRHSVVLVRWQRFTSSNIPVNSSSTDSGDNPSRIGTLILQYFLF